MTVPFIKMDGKRDTIKNNAVKELGMISEHALQMMFPLFHLSKTRQRELARSARSFDLFPGEQLLMRGFAADDYLYIAEGEITVVVNEGTTITFTASGARAQPYQIPAGAQTLRLEAAERALLYHIDREKLDFLRFWDDLRDLLDPTNQELRRRMDKIQNALAFRKLPAECLLESVRRMTSLKVEQGEVVIKQGESGADRFFMIDRGRAEVWQTGLYDDEPQLVAELGPGDTFGEEALVTGGTRSATVKMSEGGELLVLKAEDFTSFVSNPLIREVSATVAHTMMQSGYQPIDVRYLEEFEETHIPGAVLISLQDLRKRASELELGKRYIAYCRSGKRSAVAALLLTQRNFDVVSLAGGMRDWPFETSTAV